MGYDSLYHDSYPQKKLAVAASYQKEPLSPSLNLQCSSSVELDGAKVESHVC